MKAYCVVETKLGYIALASDNGKLTYSTLPQDSSEDALKMIQAGLDESSVEDISAFGDIPGRLVRYCDGEKVDFSDVAIDLCEFGPFHSAVKLAAQRMPYGELVTYRDLARMAGSERASRAAGSAMANNRTLIIVPCHRVVASGGKIGGFSSGLEWKRKFLKLEGVDI